MLRNQKQIRNKCAFTRNKSDSWSRESIFFWNLSKSLISLIFKLTNRERIFDKNTFLWNGKDNSNGARVLIEWIARGRSRWTLFTHPTMRARVWQRRKKDRSIADREVKGGKNKAHRMTETRGTREKEWNRSLTPLQCAILTSWRFDPETGLRRQHKARSTLVCPFFLHFNLTHPL